MTPDERARWVRGDKGRLPRLWDWWHHASRTIPCPRCGALHDLTVCPRLYDPDEYRPNHAGE